MFFIVYNSPHKKPTHTLSRDVRSVSALAPPTTQSTTKISDVNPFKAGPGLVLCRVIIGLYLFENMLLLSQNPAAATALTRPVPNALPIAMFDQPEIDLSAFQRDSNIYAAAAFAVLLNPNAFKQELAELHMDFHRPEAIHHSVEHQLDLESHAELTDEEDVADDLSEIDESLHILQDKMRTLLSTLDISSVERAENGTTDVFFLKDSEGQRKVVFKPANDEVSLRGAINEQAAFLLDRGLAGVPNTVMGNVNLGGEDDESETLGSAQEYIEGEDATDYGANAFAKEDVHRIGVLDIRILNRDRHAGNLMMSGKKLVPIDHALAFPSVNGEELADVSSEIFFYPQAKQPFSEEMLQAIKDIDVVADVNLLNEAGVDEDAQISVWMSTVLLKKAAAKGKTLYEIGSMVVRPGDRSEPSVLENLRTAALARGQDEFFTAFNDLVDAELCK